MAQGGKSGKYQSFKHPEKRNQNQSWNKNSGQPKKTQAQSQVGTKQVDVNKGGSGKDK